MPTSIQSMLIVEQRLIEIRLEKALKELAALEDQRRTIANQISQLMIGKP